MVQSLAAHAKAKVMSTVLHANCDAAAARVTRREAPVAHPNLVLATTILASSLAFIDGSVVNVGLPAIGRSLSADAGALQWVITERTFLAHAFRTSESGRLLYPEQIFAAPKKSGKTGFAAL